MVTRKIILIGFAITALLTALALFELLPGIVLAGISLTAGIALTYYIALSHKRIIYIGKQRILLEFTRTLTEESEPSRIEHTLIKYAQRLIPCEQAILFNSNDQKDEFEHYNYYRLPELSQWITDGEALRVDSDHPWPDSIQKPDYIQSLIGLKLKKGLTGDGKVLFLINEKNQGYFSKRDQEIVEFMIQQSVLVLDNLDKSRLKQKTLLELLKVAIRAIEAPEIHLAGHSERVAQISCLAGGKMGLNTQEMQDLFYAALLHDIGQAAANSAIDKEDPDEITDHASLGAALLPNSAQFSAIREAIMFHHEYYNGQGCPKGLKATDIPLLARIIAGADLYDALTRLMLEQENLGHEEAIEALKKTSGTILDPLVIVALEEAKDTVAQVK